MSGQGQLWDDEEPEQPARRQAPWVPNHGTPQGYYRGCRCRPCTDAKSDNAALYRQGMRRCQFCNQTYPKTTGGGTKFCASCIKSGVYWRNYTPKTKRAETACFRCATTYQAVRGKRWNFCPDCAAHPVFQQMRTSFSRHNASEALIARVIDHPHCANQACAAPLLHTIIVKAGWGNKARGDWAIDHDHTCCPGDVSCGQCIRGILCRRCNLTLRTDQPEVLRGLADYIDRHSDDKR